MLITAVTDPILHPALSVPLQLFTGWSWQFIPCPPSKMGLPTLPSNPEPRGKNRIATSTFFFFYFACYRNCCWSLQAFLELCLHQQDWAVGTGHFQEDCFAGEVTNGSSAPLGCCDHFPREHLECRAQASMSLPVLIGILI